METQGIIFGKVRYCVVFERKNDEPIIIAKHNTEDPGDMREWLAGNNYPSRVLLLCSRSEALPEGYYIKPHMTDRYFSVDVYNDVREVEPSQFDSNREILTENSF